MAKMDAGPKLDRGPKLDAGPQMDAGALVGWKANGLGNRIVLNIQTMHPGENSEKQEMRERAVLVERNQAVLLANYLYEITGQSKPRRRSLLQSLFGT